MIHFILSITLAVTIFNITACSPGIYIADKKEVIIKIIDEK